MDDLVRDIHGTIRHYAAEAEVAEVKADSAGNKCYHLQSYCPDYGDAVTITFPRPNFYQPPRDAERIYGLSGIA